MRLREFKWLAQSYKTRFCVGFHPKNCSSPKPLLSPLDQMALYWHARSLPVVKIRVSEMINTCHPLCPCFSWPGLPGPSLSQQWEEMGMLESQVPSPKDRAEMARAPVLCFLPHQPSVLALEGWGVRQTGTSWNLSGVQWGRQKRKAGVFCVI